MNVRIALMTMAALVSLTVVAWLMLHPVSRNSRYDFVASPIEGNPQFRHDLAAAPLPPPGTPRKIEFRQAQPPRYSSAVVSSP